MSSDESFFREVNEDYRRDQIAQFLKKYGAYLIGGAFVIVGVVAGYSINHYKAQQEAESGGDRYVTALLQLDDGKAVEAGKALSALAQDGPAAYRVLAKLMLAAEAVSTKKTDDALKYYREVADEGRAPQDLRDYARVQAAGLSIDTVSYDALSKELEPFRAGTSPWRFSAKETLALAAVKAGKTQDAEKLLQEIYSDGSAPRGTRKRAEDLLSLTIEAPKSQRANTTGANDAKTQ